mmetsp:Transcript_63784/g.201736  ORF Transcript_63784/g.201736 Transcript_63784/m.201736 type:complete len:703 (+) Transcript_63784:44-2152(+)
MGAVTSCVRPEQNEKEVWYDEAVDDAPKVAPPPAPPKPEEVKKAAAASKAAAQSDINSEPVVATRDLKVNIDAAIAAVEAKAEGDKPVEVEPVEGDAEAKPKVPAAWEKHVGRALGLIGGINKGLERHGMDMGRAGAVAFFSMWICVALPRPFSWTWCIELLAGVGVGAGSALMVSKAYYGKRKSRKERAIAYYDMGSKIEGPDAFEDLKKLLGDVPSWVNFKDFERVDWLNGILKKLWPYYDTAICRIIKESVEPILDQYRPPGITYMGFHTLTFGTSPFVIDGMRYHEAEGDKDDVTLELDFRWAGASKIILAVDVMGIRLVPQIRNLRLYGTFRIILKPLCDTIPCFGGLVASMSAPPIIQYKLDFGDISLMSVATKPAIGLVRMFVDDLILNILTSMLVWPNRIVIPILGNEFLPKGEESLTELELRVKGYARVKVVKIEGLPRMDTFGKTDGYCELQIRSSRTIRTKTVKSNLNPVFDEEFDMLVEEPKSQYLKIQVYDQENWPKPDDFIGRCRVPLSECEHGKSKTFVMDLGEEEWAEKDLGSGQGKITVEVELYQFSKMDKKAEGRGVGALFIRLVRGIGLKKCDMLNDSDPFVEFTVNNPTKTGKHHFATSQVIDNTLDPKWEESFEFIKCEEGSSLELKCWDKDPIGRDPMGDAVVPISEIIAAGGKIASKIVKLQNVECGEIELGLEWIPFA